MKFLMYGCGWDAWWWELCNIMFWFPVTCWKWKNQTKYEKHKVGMDWFDDIDRQKMPEF